MGCPERRDKREQEKERTEQERGYERRVAARDAGQACHLVRSRGSIAA
jgi:hypothetical protein